MPLKILLLPFIFTVTAAATAAQDTLTTASVTGRVLDPSGAAVARAVVTSTQVETGQTRSAVTDSYGRFRFPFLPVGRYRFHTQPAGFAATDRALQLTVGAAFDLPLSLVLEQIRSTVDVTAQPLVIEGNRSQISETILPVEINNLPYNGRNYLDLALLAPGVSPTNTNSVQTFAETSPIVGQGYSVNSQRNFSNSFVVDGLSANDDAAGLAGNSYALDVVREFQVVTSGGQAEFGRALGGYLNIVTRSGTNDLHGTIYGFLRNQRLDANNALSRGKLPETQGQFGVSVSGPLRRDHTFFFANYEGRRLNTDGIVTITPFNAAVINAHLAVVGYKAPLLAVGTGPTTLFPTTVHTDNGFARLDHEFNSKDQLTVRYSYYGLNSINARGAGGLAAVSYGTAELDTNHTIAISNVATLSPHFFNETRGQFTSDNLNAPPNDEIGPQVTIAGIATFGRLSASPTARQNYLYEAVDNLVAEHGAHTIKTGAVFLFNNDTITFPQSLRGAYTFSSLATFLAGAYNIQGYTQSFGTSSVEQQNPNVGIYAQDEWKASPKLTLNAGIRYDLQFLRSIATDTHNVSPRIGFAWSPYAKQRTVLRGSYGLFYDRLPLRALANALLSANNTTNPAQAALLSYTFSPGQTGAPVFPFVAATPPSGALLNYTLMDPHIQNAESQQASVELEQQFAASNTLAISYQHVRGLHLITSINSNIESDGSHANPAYANSRGYQSKADSQYDGLAVSFVQRPVPWGSMRLSYTWSKAIDDVGQFYFSSPLNNFDPGEDRSRSDNDQRHRVVYDASVTSPTRPASDLAAHLTQSWRLSGILQYYSRLPFNIVTGTTSKQGTTLRPCAPGYSLTANGGTNPCTEALPGAVIGRNAGVGFALFTLNVRLGRSFALTERLKLEGIAEAFNALNHRNDMIPNGTWGTGAYPSSAATSFGQATAVGDPRGVQLAARLNF